MSLFQPQVGVYRITHEPSGRYYIGSSKKLTIRFGQHRSALERGTHHCKFLQAVWNCGEAAEFTFEAIANCQTWGDALDLEQALLDETAGDRRRMNGSGRARMPILSPEVMAKARTTANASTVYIESHRQVCLARNASPEFQAKATQAMRASAKHKAAVKQNAKGLQRPDVKAKNRAAILASGKQAASAAVVAARLNSDPGVIRKRLEATCRAVIGVHLETGESVSFPSQSAAARFVGAAPSNVSMCCAGKLESCKGYRWSAVP